MHVARMLYARFGYTNETIRQTPSIVTGHMPTLSDFIETMKEIPAPREDMRTSLLGRFEKASYLFSGQTQASIDKPLTVFSIRDLDEKWYALMTFTVQNFLMRHRAFHHSGRYLAYVVEEASFLLRHPAGRTYLENASRGFRKLGIAQFTLSQNPQEFLSNGAVLMNNCGAALYLGMQSYVARELHLQHDLEQAVTAQRRGHGIIRVGNEYAPIAIRTTLLHRKLFSTKPSTGHTSRTGKGQRERDRTHALVG